MTDAINDFVYWYQGLPMAAQVGIPVAGAAGIFLIARHKGASGEQVFGPGSSVGGSGTGTAPGPPGISPILPGPPAPGSPPPSSGPGLPVPPGGGTKSPPTGTPSTKPSPTGTPSSGPTRTPVVNNTPERRTQPAPTQTASAGYRKEVGTASAYTFGRPIPGASHPIYTGQGNAYMVNNNQDIARSPAGQPPIRPGSQIGPTAAQQRQHVMQSDVRSKVSKAPEERARRRQRAGFDYSRSSAPPRPRAYRPTHVQAPPGAIQRGGRLVF